MSNKEQLNADQQIDLIAERVTDLSAAQLQRVQKFMESGTPGIALIDESKMFRMLDLYLGGKSYTQISRMTGTDKDMVLYLSHKMDWYQAKQEYLVDLNNNLQERLLETKLISQNFLTDLVAFWHKKIGTNINKYLATGDEAAAEKIVGKDIDKYLKTVEILQKLTEKGGGDGQKPSPVGLNLGENGVTVKKVGEGEVEITPKSKAIGSVLKDLANLKRAEENKKPEKSGNNE